MTKTEITQYGFIWGPLEVRRLVSDNKFGVVIKLKTNKESIDVRITPSGLIRLEEIIKVKK